MPPPLPRPRLVAGAARSPPFHPSCYRQVGPLRPGTRRRIQLQDLTYPRQYATRSSLLDVERWIIHAITILPDS